MDEAVKRNMSMFSDAMKMWPGFGALTPGAMAAARPRASPEPAPAADPLEEMRRQMDEMRNQIDKLSKTPGKGG